MYLQITDQDAYDFILGVISLRAQEGDVSRTWKVPGRLMRRADLAYEIAGELMAEVREAVQRGR